MPYKDYNKKMAEYMLRRYHQRRAAALEKLGGKCSVCGTQGNLEIDHIDADEKEIALNKMWSIAEERFLKELAKCQLLCKQHHEEKSIVDRGTQRAKGTHGTVSSYRYCKCDLCREAWNKHSREYRRKRRAVSSIGRASAF